MVYRPTGVRSPDAGVPPRPMGAALLNQVGSFMPGIADCHISRRIVRLLTGSTTSPKGHPEAVSLPERRA